MKEESPEKPTAKMYICGEDARREQEILEQHQHRYKIDIPGRSVIIIIIIMNKAS